MNWDELWRGVMMETKEFFKTNNCLKERHMVHHEVIHDVEVGYKLNTNQFFSKQLPSNK